ncbi:TRAP transporter small permease subunit [Psychromarinibacter sp. C21-152]|uniref:TRAP transporter small permease protein n=1 Tax=Psychromarinibacter sediminicola TaxID=3033385 RepID=A0AAE3NTA1_9RHOB|nr:TRAP transporter small permease subunit [Psychromarinibacter sediminicola]MDF0601259.1 TRAP transporter small permease subunit [Psychromarinibacter sediminicola]
MAETGVIATLRGALGAVARAGLWISVLLLVAISALVAGQVVARNVFSLGLPWADELARWFGIALVYLTIPHLLDRGSHIAVEFLPDRLAGKARAAVLAVSDLSVAAFAGISLVAFAGFLDRAARFKTPALGIPNMIFYIPALLGIVLLGLVAILRLAELVRGGERRA